jgi:hypothetical protein
VEAIRLEIPGMAAAVVARPVIRRQRRPRPEPPPIPVPAPAPVVYVPFARPSPPLSAPSPPTEKRGFPLWPLALAALGAAALLLRPQAPKERLGPALLPYSEATGLSLRGDFFSSMDAPRLLVYTFDASGVVRSIEKLPHVASALAWSERGLWTAAPDGQVCLHQVSEGFPASVCYVNPERRPSALHWDGQQLWLADSRTETVQALFPGKALAMRSQHSLPGVRPSGLHIEGGRLWVLDAAGGRILRYELKTLAAPVDQASLLAWTGGSRPAGFAFKDGRLHLVLERPAGLRSLALSELQWSKL